VKELMAEYERKKAKLLQLEQVNRQNSVQR